MAKKDSGKKPLKPSKPDAAKVKKTPEDVFAFWNDANMREAKPIPLDIDRPKGGSEK